MWAALADAYGNAFTSQFGDEPNQVWADGLDRYSDEDILLAVGQILDSGGEYAPNLAAVLGRLNVAKAPNQHLMYRTANEALNAPIVDMGEGRALPAPQIGPEIPFGDFKALWSGL